MRVRNNVSARRILFTLTQNRCALSLDQTLGLCVRAQNLYSLLDLMLPEEQPGLWAMGIHRQKNKSPHKTTDVL